MTLSEVEELCVFRFPGNQHREMLFLNFEQLVQAFLTEHIVCDMLLNGSFLTAKEKPSDVDVAIRLDCDFSDTMSPAQDALISEVNTSNFIAHVDAFVYVAYHRDHKNYGIERPEEWAETYGLENSETWLKGIAVLRLWETNVGLRIRR